ncbi:DgyrCDS11881 [Dimorphilus gyrociliatus]|uniref:DgyrCDS11881 n=1 Tax=Dimorphilus gyrociliatus TaxID=2664684 RepID=A0A7I8W8D0_9ANNE|nr:DgyrCDS11881 [Dimorphilus gyrociliatus]
MDWIRLGKSKPDLAGTRGKILTVTAEELAKHNKPNDAWMAIRGRVYNVTPYMDFHPGGIMELMRGVGMDATELFMEVHKWVNAESMLEKCYVGKMETNLPVPQGLQANSQDIKEIPKSEMEKDIASAYSYKGNEPITSWEESDLNLNFIVYGKRPLQEEDVVIDRLNNRYEIHIFCEKPSKKAWLIHFEPKYKLSDKNISTTVENIQGEIYRLIITFKKALPGKWNSLGKFLNSNLSFDNRPDWSMTISKPYTVVPQNLLPQANDKNDLGSTCSLMIKIYDNGFTTCLRGLKVGESIIAGNYEGSFDLEKLKRAENLVMIAAGTGFTPMTSLIHYCLQNQDDKKVKLMFFNKTEEDILWARDLCVLQETNSNFNVINVLSQPSANWQGPTGRIRKEILENWLPAAISPALVCVCGPSPFTETTFLLLKDEFHFPEEKLHMFIS